MESFREAASQGRVKGSQGDKEPRVGQARWGGRACSRRYLTMSHFHCSPSGQKLLTPSRYRRALCSVSAHTTLFRAVTWDSGYGQSTFTALAQGRSTLRPAGETDRKPPRHTVRTSHLICIVLFAAAAASFFGILLYSCVASTLSF